MIDFDNKAVFKLKQDDDFAEKVQELLLDDESIVDAFKTMRDGVVFTSKRLIVVNVQGMTGSKKDFSSLPYNKVIAWSIETSGTLDIDAELELYFSALGKVKFEFSGQTNMVDISRVISSNAL